MNIGAELPFRRNRFARNTGSLILDHHRDKAEQDAAPNAQDMLIWNQGRFSSAKSAHSDDPKS